MTWKKYIHYICNKIAKGIGILVRARQLLYGESLVTIYNALIKPHFMYCITAWGNTYKTNITRLHLMQKKIIRVLTRSEFYAHTKPLFNKLHMMNIFEMQVYFVGIFVFKCVNNVLPDNWNCTFTHNQIARLSLNLRPHFCKRQSCQFAIKVTGPTVWKKFPNQIKMAKSLYSFKKLLKHELLKCPCV